MQDRTVCYLLWSGACCGLATELTEPSTQPSPSTAPLPGGFSTVR